MSQQIETKRCPNCNRYLKPRMVEINGQNVIRLGCRYCNPVKKEITPMKGAIIPKECPDIDCRSKNIKLSSIDKNGIHYWKCEDCKICFEWHKYNFSFHIHVEVESTPEDAETIAWEKTDSGEMTLLGCWEEGKYNAHVNLTLEEREPKKLDNNSRSPPNLIKNYEIKSNKNKKARKND